jgi:hypothetical protein
MAMKRGQAERRHQFRRLDRPGRGQEQAAHDRHAGHAPIPHEAVLDEKPFLVPAHQARLQRKTLERFEPLAEFRHRVADDRPW